VALWQLASGLSNVVLGWPLIGAVAHTAGAAAWVTLLTLLITRALRAPASPAP
jgi:cytochrome c oxidase assembly protein subunit 15